MSADKVEPLELVEMEESPIDPDVSQQPFSPKFRTEWREGEAQVVEAIIRTANEEVSRRFAEAFAVEYAFLSKVREPELDAYGNPVRGGDGRVQWKRNPDGTVHEDWANVTLRDMDEFIMHASAWAFFGAQDNTDIWAEAVVAKLMLDEEYAEKYASMLSGTVADKQSRANRFTQDSRYFAAYLAILSRKANEIVNRLDQTVRRVENIRNQRTKDVYNKLRS